MVNVAVFDAIGALAFLITFCGALKNYQSTKELSPYWLIFAIASFSGFIWASLVALEWGGFYPALMDIIEQSIVASMATAFAIAAMLVSVSIIRPVR